MSGLRPIPIDNTASSHKLQKVCILFPAFLCIFNLLLPRFYIKQFSLKKLKKSVRSSLSSVRRNEEKILGNSGG